MHSAVRRAELGLLLIALSVLALGLLAGVVIAAHVSQPLRRLEAVARRVARGDLSARAEVEGSREQRSLSRSFNEMTDRVVRLLAAQREFVADASHQLRTPLTGLRLRLEEARRILTNPEAGAELDAAIAEVDRLSHTVDELLVLSRAGERELTGAPIDLTALAASTARRTRNSPPQQPQGPDMLRLATIRLIIGLAAFTLLLGAPQGRAADDDILIGAVYPLTGNSAPIGTDAKAAIGAIVDIINGTHAPIPMLMGKGGGLPALGGAQDQASSSPTTRTIRRRRAPRPSA